MAHARLAIVDLDPRSDQPMRDPSHRYWLTYNGQIFNFPELRAELETLGHRFETTGDTEVILRAYMQWGQACLERFQGMFAFVIVDKQKRHLFAARDRFGIKPLYYLMLGKRIAIASEIKQFQAIEDVQLSANKTIVGEYLSLGTQDHTTATFFSEVEQLSGGHCFTIDLDRIEQPVPQKWYNPEISPSGNSTLAEAAEAFLPLFRETISMHLRSDVTVGGCLSAGIDSSCIAAMMKQLRGSDGEPFQFVTAAFDGEDFDEGKGAADFADKLEVAHAIIRPTPENFLDQLDDLIWKQDEPFGSTSIFAQHQTFALAQQLGAKVMLDGQGADEIAGGYYSFFPRHLTHLLGSYRCSDFIRTLRYRAVHLDIPVWRQLGSLGKLFAPSAASFRSSGELLKVNSNIHQPLTFETFRQSTIEKTALPAMLHWEDRNSMAHGVEARVPFLHHPIVEFFQSLPVNFLYENGKTKPVLRRTGSTLIEHPVFGSDKKIGFSTPQAKWLSKIVQEGITPDYDRLNDLFGDQIRMDGLRTRWMAIESGTDLKDCDLLFRILCLSRWLNVFDLKTGS